MKRLFAVLVLLMTSSCVRAHVLSSDGSHEVVVCDWSDRNKIFDCIAKACPNGYDVVSTIDVDEDVIKCKP